MEQSTSSKPRRTDVTAWRAIVTRWQSRSLRRASWQLVNTLVPYVGLWALMYWCMQVSWLLALPVAMLTGLMMVRAFIIFHDCGHGSFLASRRANAFWGRLIGVLTFTPYAHWTGEHASHHGTAGNLSRRGVGDLWTMTVAEYDAATPWRRFCYRVARNPVVLLGVAPLLLLLGMQRFSRKEATTAERWSVWTTNASLVLFAIGMSQIYGFAGYAYLQLVVLAVGGAVGIWLFYLQHQFEGAYWEHSSDWDYTDAALKGSSFLRLPKVLQWFTGNIGFHHIHHLSPRIPNYNLERCHRSEPIFSTVPAITFWQGFRAFGLKLWDESAKKLVGYGQLNLRR